MQLNWDCCKAACFPRCWKITETFCWMDRILFYIIYVIKVLSLRTDRHREIWRLFSNENQEISKSTVLTKYLRSLISFYCYVFLLWICTCLLNFIQNEQPNWNELPMHVNNMQTSSQSHTWMNRINRIKDREQNICFRLSQLLRALCLSAKKA